jgi:hypothetical protein
MATKKGKSVTDWENAADSSTPTVFYRTLNVEGLEIFYREAGPRDAPTVLLSCQTSRLSSLEYPLAGWPNGRQ